MPKDNLALLGEYLKSVRNEAHLTQEQLSDLSHVSVKHIADIEKGLKNPSFVILQSLARVLNFSLDNLIWDNPNTEEHDLNELKASYYSCPPEMREFFLKNTQSLSKELQVLSESLKQK